MDLVVGHIYRAKKPKCVRLFREGDFYDDRQILYIGTTSLQFNSVTVISGRRYPMIDRERFEKWAGEDVTEGYPKGEWAPWPNH